MDIVLKPLTREGFASFGNVIEAALDPPVMINGGTTERYHALATADTEREGGGTILNIFRGTARRFPYDITMMERHPLGSQAFVPMNGRTYVVVVAPDEGGRPGQPCGFLARGDQGVQYARNVWHHPLIAVGETSDFLVVDRAGPGVNLEEIDYAAPYRIAAPTV